MSHQKEKGAPPPAASSSSRYERSTTQHEDGFQVKKVVNKKVMDGALMYLVNWKDYPATMDSWVPADSIRASNPFPVWKYEAQSCVACGWHNPLTHSTPVEPREHTVLIPACNTCGFINGLPTASSGAGLERAKGRAVRVFDGKRMIEIAGVSGPLSITTRTLSDKELTTVSPAVYHIAPRDPDRHFLTSTKQEQCAGRGRAVTLTNTDIWNIEVGRSLTTRFMDYWILKIIGTFQLVEMTKIMAIGADTLHDLKTGSTDVSEYVHNTFFLMAAEFFVIPCKIGETWMVVVVHRVMDGNQVTFNCCSIDPANACSGNFTIVQEMIANFFTTAAENILAVVQNVNWTTIETTDDNETINDVDSGIYTLRALETFLKLIITMQPDDKPNLSPLKVEYSSPSSDRAVIAALLRNEHKQQMLVSNRETSHVPPDSADASANATNSEAVIEQESDNENSTTHAANRTDSIQQSDETDNHDKCVNAIREYYSEHAAGRCTTWDKVATNAGTTRSFLSKFRKGKGQNLVDEIKKDVKYTEKVSTKRKPANLESKQKRSRNYSKSSAKSTKPQTETDYSENVIRTTEQGDPIPTEPDAVDGDSDHNPQPDTHMEDESNRGSIATGTDNVAL